MNPRASARPVSLLLGTGLARLRLALVHEALAAGQNFSHFGPEANLFDKLEELFRTYGETGSGLKRYYLHSPEEAAEHNSRLGVNLEPGQFTPWEDLPSGTDVLFYEGLHGGVKGDGFASTLVLATGGGLWLACW